eukprot:gene16315-19404_t
MSAEKIPVTLISGFLGAGKTTFLNYILNENHGKKIAVIQNEYGQQIGIETAMIVGDDGSKVSEWLEFPNGCICCTVKDDFLRSIEELLKKKSRFDYILIESTGMGDPGHISSSLWVDDELESPIYLDSIITLVDAKNVLKQIDGSLELLENKEKEEDKKKEGETKVGSKEAIRQIAFADVVLLNKIDLVDEDTLSGIRQQINAINPLCKIVHTERSVVQLDAVLDIKSYTPNLDVIQEEGEFDLQELNRWFGAMVWDEYKDKVLRMKGLLSVKGATQKYILQGVYETFEILPSGIDWQQDEKRHNKIVLIGEQLNQSEIQQSFQKMFIK